MFPSPCGVLVLKFHEERLGHDCLLCFRPLGGSSCLASPVSTGEVASNASRWERLCLAYTSNAMKVYSLRSWRPLHRLHGPPPPLWQGRLEIRSVPLRGYGFEIKLYKGSTTTYADWFPSPCGDSPILASPVATGGSGEQREPMGALVPCVHFCRYEDLRLASMAPPPPLTRSPC